MRLHRLIRPSRSFSVNGWTVQAHHYPHVTIYKFGAAYGLHFFVRHHGDHLVVDAASPCCRAMVGFTSRYDVEGRGREVAGDYFDGQRVKCRACQGKVLSNDPALAVTTYWYPGQVCPPALVAYLEQVLNPLDAVYESGTVVLMLENLYALHSSRFGRHRRHRRAMAELLKESA